jgi:3-oxoacyl-[acyl-carrier-protein] synthase-3
MVDSSVLGIAYHLPETIETNDDLQRQNPDWRMDDVYAKSGIRQRHIVGADETASDLGFVAAAALLERQLVPVEEIDYLLFCTQSPDHFLPTAACVLQQRLGLGKHIGALDFNLGCSGFVYGLQLAQSLVAGGAVRNVLLITADTYTKFIHPRDRTVRTLFGDGAAATLVGPATGTGRIGRFVVGSDGKGAGNLIVPAGGARLPASEATAVEVTDEAGCTRCGQNLFMDGPAIFTFAISVVPRAVDRLLTEASITVDKIDWFVYHQANRYMLEQLAKRNKIPLEKMVIDVEDLGNTVSASIPIALQRGVEAGRIRCGHRLLLVGFGVGYSWAACDMTWGSP